SNVTAPLPKRLCVVSTTFRIDSQPLPFQYSHESWGTLSVSPPERNYLLAPLTSTARECANGTVGSVVLSWTTPVSRLYSSILLGATTVLPIRNSRTRASRRPGTALWSTKRSSVSGWAGLRSSTDGDVTFSLVVATSGGVTGASTRTSRSAPSY